MKTNNPKISSEKLTNLQAEMDWSRQRPALFLAAWKRGVKLAGEEYFNIKVSVDSSTDKNQLSPNYKMIEQSIRSLSLGQQAFLAAMYTFYDSDGEKLLRKINRPTMADISSCLDKERLEIISELFVNYSGW